MSYIANEKRYETMKYRYCGKSGLQLPVMSFGLWHNFGDMTPYEKSKEMLLGAFDLGITHFDLANNYGPKPGAAEETLGKILKKELQGYRDELLISTKAGYGMWDGPYQVGGSKKYLISSLDQSLKRMGLDYVDIFYHHRPDTNTPIEETVEALEQIVRSGKALYVGISNYDPIQTKEIYDELKSRRIHCLIHQLRYSMLDQSRTEVIEVCNSLGVGTIAFCPLEQGVLTDRYLKGIPSDSRAASGSVFLNSEQITEEKLVRIRALNELAKERGQSLAQMALAWVLHNTTSVIIGASRLEQIQDNVNAMKNMEFSKDELTRINTILNGGK